MDPAIIAALIGPVVTFILGASAQGRFRSRSQSKRIGELKAPYITGKWDSEWYFHDGKEERRYSRELIEITKQQWAFFEGRGKDTTRGYDYPLKGQFNSHGIITFSYDFEDQAKAIAGSGVLKLNATNDECSGFWHGYTRENKMIGGRVVWHLRNT